MSENHGAPAADRRAGLSRKKRAENPVNFITGLYIMGSSRHY
jgi:hypothetical protein